MLYPNHSCKARCLRRYLEWCAGLERVFDMLMGPGGPAGPGTPPTADGRIPRTGSGSSRSPSMMHIGRQERLLQVLGLTVTRKIALGGYTTRRHTAGVPYALRIS